MLEVDLVVLDPAEREREIDLQGADVRVDLIRGRQIDLGEPAEDLVALVHIALVELVMSFDRLPRDPVQLVEGRFQLPWEDLLVVERQRRHRCPFLWFGSRGSITLETEKPRDA